MRVRINWLVSAITTLPLIAVGAVLIFMGLRSDPRALTDDGLMSQRNFFILMGVFFIGLNTLIGGGMLLFAFMRNQRIERLEQTGIRGQAKILQIRQTGVYVNEQPQFWMELQVDLPGNDPYFVERKMVVPFMQIQQLQEGAVLEVLVDPKRTGNARGVELLLK